MFHEPDDGAVFEEPGFVGVAAFTISLLVQCILDFEVLLPFMVVERLVGSLVPAMAMMWWVGKCGRCVICVRLVLVLATCVSVQS